MTSEAFFPFFFFWSVTFVQVFPDLHKQINPEHSCLPAAVRDERPADRV